MSLAAHSPSTQGSTRSHLPDPCRPASASWHPPRAPSVWSADLDRATAVAERLEAGSVWVNQHPVVTATIPFGGAKQSGIGVESSLHGLLEYTNIKVLNVKRR